MQLFQSSSLLRQRPFTFSSVQFISVTQSCPTLQPHELQHARPPCPSPSPGVHSDSRPSSQWCHPAISFSVVPFFSCPQSLPASKSFPMSQLFARGVQSTGVSAPLQYSCLENPMNSMIRQNDRILKEVLPRSVGAQYATGGQWRNNSWKNEGLEPKKKQYPAVDVTGDRSKVRCCKEQYCIGTWNVSPWIKENWKWSNKRWQEWTLTF